MTREKAARTSRTVAGATAPSPRIDREKLRTQVRRLYTEAHLRLLDRAIDLLPESRLPSLIEGYIRLSDLAPDERGPRPLVEVVRAFHEESVRGKYFDDAAVRSRGFTHDSHGTAEWNAEYHRLLEQCIKLERRGQQQEACACFELIFDLLRRIDECQDIVFFADEAGSWQVGVDWEEVFPAWFRCLAETTSKEEYRAQVERAVTQFGGYRREQFLEQALSLARSSKPAHASLGEDPP